MNMPTSVFVPCEVPAPLLRAWEAVYRDYVSSDRVNARSIRDREEQAQLSARVAVTWRRMAEAPGVDYWLMVALYTAAEAMERQAHDWAPHGRRSA